MKGANPTMLARPLSSCRRALPQGPALITGASSGIGAAFARRLAARGCDLLLVARRGDRLAALAAELRDRHGVRAEPLPLDLTAEADLAALEQRFYGGADLSWLIHAAGFGTRGRFVDQGPPTLQAQLRLHAEAALRLTRAVLPGMVARGNGALVLVSSLASFFSSTHYTSYSATKAYLNMLVEGLRDELAGSGVTAQALCPGLTRTGFFDSPSHGGFAYTQVPALFWQQPAQVVDESLHALARGRSLCIPGRHNRAFFGAMHTPGLGRLLATGLGWLSRLQKR